MAITALQNVTSSAKNKAKKKLGKSIDAPSASKDSSALNSPHAGPVDEAPEESNPHIRETQKQIRNVTKKLNATAKVDSIIAENPGVSLDDLVAQRKINNDQKAQAVKKPQLQAQVAALEAQLAVYRELDNAYEKKSSKDKEALLAAHATELEKVREEARISAQQGLNKELKTRLLTFSRFLAAAANRRNQGEDNSDEGRAFEGALLLVYGGDINAVEAAEKIINGAAEKVPTVDGSPANTTFAKVKELSLAETPYVEASFEGDAAGAAPTTGQTEPTSDPTIANAGLTELEDGSANAGTNGIASLSLNDTQPPPATSIDPSAANETAGTQWDSAQSGSQVDPLGESYEVIPRDPAEVDNPPATTGVTASQSWSDEVAAEQPDTNGNDGFHEVTHHRGGRRGGFRGGDRGHRGGRGRGGFRGGDRGGRGRGGYRGRGRGD